MRSIYRSHFLGACIKCVLHTFYEVVYGIDYSTEYESIFRVGLATDMAKRKKIYNTHTLHNHNVIIIQDSKCPARLESCIKALLFKHRYYFNGKIKKDFFKCSFEKLKTSFDQCTESIKCVDKQKGGSKTAKKHDLYLKPYNRFFDNRIKHLLNKINKLNKKCTKLDVLIKKNIK